MKRRQFFASAALGALPLANAASTAQSDREYWLRFLLRIGDPVLSALSEQKLKASMPVEAPHGNVADRAQYTHLEAFGRTIAGLSAWLELDGGSSAEVELRKRYRELARRSISAAVNPDSRDYMNFTHGGQPVVDAAFLALGVLRAPRQLWSALDSTAKKQLLNALRATRIIRPGFSNWLLFSATIEAFFCFAGEEWDAMRVDYAVRQIDEWYKGDGVYGDGPEFHWDYYNSFVIHPMLLAVLKAVSPHSNAWAQLEPAIRARAQRYAAIQERLINPDGSFPALGRSLAYRTGAFHLLADRALNRALPEALPPEQARSGLSAVIRRTLEAPGTFDERGWLRVGLCGHQPGIAESYISTGSLYLCSTVFLPLGLPPDDPFWSNPAQDWTSRKIWSGENAAADHAL